MKKYSLDLLTVGQLATNCYIFSDAATKDTAVIDPGANSIKIINYLQDNNLSVSAIINTHGHFDHITANGKVSEFTGAPIFIHSADKPWLMQNKYGLSDGQAARFVSDEEIIQIGDNKLKVLHTPGHSPGGISLYLAAEEAGEAGLLFCGDTLFLHSIGRTDLTGGDFETLLNSICQKLLVLPDDTIVLPGHGPSTTIGQEKKLNPYLRP